MSSSRQWQPHKRYVEIMHQAAHPDWISNIYVHTSNTAPSQPEEPRDGSFLYTRRGEKTLRSSIRFLVHIRSAWIA